MKNFFLKLTSVALFLAMVVATGCDGLGKRNGKFSVSIRDVGPEYVELSIDGGELIEMAYIITKVEYTADEILPGDVFKKGTEIATKGGDVVRLSLGIEQNTQYYLYVCARKSAEEFTKLFILPFKTGQYDLSELITVVDHYYDGYKVRLTLPKETKDRKNAIRYNQCCIMMYNYMMGQGNDDYRSLLYNGDCYVVGDSTLVYTEENNWYVTDTDSDGDGELDWDTHYNPISPGEPVVFVAGEFSWMREPANVDEPSPDEDEYFMFPAGWPSGYYYPCINTDYYNAGAKSQSGIGVIPWDFKHPMDDYWTGAFQRKHLRVKQPDLLEAGVEIKLADVSPVNATIEFYPDKDVYSYAVGIFDEATYNNQVLPLLNNNPDYMQWAITSYFAAYTFGTVNLSGASSVKLTTFYYQSAIAENTKYYVFVTAMGNPEASAQSFQTFEFTTTEKVLSKPVIEVTPVESKTTPFKATFNVKCTTYKDNPIMEAYYAANYVRDWMLATNGGSTYFSLLNGNNQFTASELALINSEAGYEISFASVDGETTRLAVLGYNTEYTPNDVSSYKTSEILECPAVADVTTPWAPVKDVVDPIHYNALRGVWTATATLQDGVDANGTYTYSSKITIGDNIPEYPKYLSQEVYDIYMNESEKDEEEVDALWTQFKQQAESFAVNRLMNQNRLLCTGWLDDDSYGRLTARTPYDLFIATDYSSVDVSSIFNDFGPKWYIEAVKDEKTGEVSLIAPVDANLLPPTSAWSVPFYMAAMEPKNYYTFTYPQVEGELFFPVEYDAEKDQITIKPFVYDDVEYFPNVIGVDSQTQGTILENPVVSEVVLTRGWSEPSKEQSSVRNAGDNVQANGDFPKVNYKERTELKAAPALNQVEMTPVNEAEFRKRADKMVERFVNQKR
ncbi:MAG: hypothetical protein IKV75_02700 [Bacteroidales bacterium]|nr:hypothetical protein [Bacteroidales bacterium]